MTEHDRMYVIDPAETDPDLLRKLTPLGDLAGVPPSPEADRCRKAQPARPPGPARPAGSPPPAQPALLLLAAFMLGPLSILLTAAGRGRRERRIFAAAAAAGAAAAAVVWWQAPIRYGPGDLAWLLQLGAIAVSWGAWLAAWSLGIHLASRRCGDGPWSTAGARRPVAAAGTGLLAPGLGLLLTGHPWRTIATVAMVGSALLAALAIRSAGAWWAWHRQCTAPIVTDRQFEIGVAILAALVALGALSWLVSALDAARLTAPPLVMRRAAAANRAPAALLAALLAFSVLYQPAGVAGAFDQATARLADQGFLLLPFWTAAVAAHLDPSVPAYAWRLAQQQDELGRTADADATRQALAERWWQYLDLLYRPSAPGR